MLSPCRRPVADGVLPETASTIFVRCRSQDVIVRNRRAHELLFVMNLLSRDREGAVSDTHKKQLLRNSPMR